MILGKEERKQKRPEKRIETLKKEVRFLLIKSRVSICRLGTMI